MKKFDMAIWALLAVLLVVPVAFADKTSGELPGDARGIKVQGHVAIPSTVRNDTVTGTNPKQSITTKTYTTLQIDCTDTALVAKPCKVEPNSQSGYIAVPSGSAIIPIHSTMSSVRFKSFSAATSSTTIFNSSLSK